MTERSFIYYNNKNKEKSQCEQNDRKKQNRHIFMIMSFKY